MTTQILYDLFQVIIATYTIITIPIPIMTIIKHFMFTNIYASVLYNVIFLELYIRILNIALSIKKMYSGKNLLIQFCLRFQFFILSSNSKQKQDKQNYTIFHYFYLLYFAVYINTNIHIDI